MTTEEAIEQLDWYFYQDDGRGADDTTKQSYETLKTLSDYTCRDSISRQELITALRDSGWINEDKYNSSNVLKDIIDSLHPVSMTRKDICKAYNIADIGDFSDGFHTFNGLYFQRMVLFAALVKVYKDKSWKSYKHEDGKDCFGGGWFIVGIDTPQGSYTYHYENKYWDMFDCVELPTGKHWTDIPKTMWKQEYCLCHNQTLKRGTDSDCKIKR